MRIAFYCILWVEFYTVVVGSWYLPTYILCCILCKQLSPGKHHSKQLDRCVSPGVPGCDLEPDESYWELGQADGRKAVLIHLQKMLGVEGYASRIWIQYVRVMEAMLLWHTRTRTFDLTSANVSLFYYSTVYLVFVYFFQALPFLMQMTQSNPRLFEQNVFMIQCWLKTVPSPVPRKGSLTARWPETLFKSDSPS